MARDLTRWIGGTLVACALIALALLPPQGRTIALTSVRRSRLPEARVWNRAQRHLGAAQLALRTLETRDSLLPHIERFTNRGDRLVVLTDPRLSARSDTVVRSVLEHARLLFDSSRSGMAAAVVLLADPSAVSFRPAYIAPLSSGGRSCIALLRFGQRQLRQIENGMTPAVLGGVERLLGPCAYFAAFGNPGPHVAEWLAGTAYQRALSPEWAVNPNLPRLAERAVPDRRRISSFGTRFFGVWPELGACAAGRTAICRQAVIDTTWFADFQTYSALHRPRGVAYSVAQSAWWFGRGDPLGSDAPELLSDLVADMGMERFRGFWQSDLPLDSAFARAFGLPIEEWTMRWVRSRVGSLEHGVPLPFSSALLGLLVVGLFVGGSAWYATRHQAG